MKIYGDYHTHTTTSDGHSSLEDNVRVARERGLKEMVVCDHSFSSIIFHMTRAKFARQACKINDINAQGGLKLFHGIEANIFADGSLDVPDDIIRNLDVLNVGFHRLIQLSYQRGSGRFINGNGYASESERMKLIGMNTDAYLRAMEIYPIDTLCHLNHRAMVDTAAICTAAAQKGVYIELNEKHLDSIEKDIDVALKSGVSFIIGSDAHNAAKVGRFDRLEEFVLRHSIPIERVYGLNGKSPQYKHKSDWCNPTE